MQRENTVRYSNINLTLWSFLSGKINDGKRHKHSIRTYIHELKVLKGVRGKLLKKFPPQKYLLHQYPPLFLRKRQMALRMTSAGKTESESSMVTDSSRKVSGAVRKTLPPK